MKILVLTSLDLTERGDDVWLGSSAYASVEAMREVLRNDWDAERDFDLKFEEDPTEQQAIRDNCEDVKDRFDAWLNDPEGGKVLQDQETSTSWRPWEDPMECIEFRWYELHGAVE